MSDREAQLYAICQLIEGFYRRAEELGASSGAIEIVIGEILAITAIRQTPSHILHARDRPACPLRGEESSTGFSE